jgi:hypothetical protein
LKLKILKITKKTIMLIVTINIIMMTTTKINNNNNNNKIKLDVLLNPEKLHIPP